MCCWAAAVAAAAAPARAAAVWKWSVSHVSARDGLIGVACPSTKVCVAITGGGKVLSSGDPAAGAHAWKTVAGLTVLQTGGTLAQQNTAAQFDDEAYDLSCPSAHLCLIGQPGLSRVAGDAPPIDPVGSIVYSTDPLGGAAAWHTVKGIDHNAGEIASLSCPSTHLCYAVAGGVDKFGNGHSTPLMTTDPTGGPAAWHVAGTTINDYIDGLACPSAALCVAAGGSGLYWAKHPTGSRSKWSFVHSTNNDGQIDRVACPSTSLCIAQPDQAGCKPCGAPNDLFSTNPLTGVWHQGPVATNNISCHGITLCIGPGGGSAKPQPEIDYSATPNTQARWQSVLGLAHDLVLRAISCASTRFCVGVGDAGAVVVGQA
jgi:hypothetical protein